MTATTRSLVFSLTVLDDTDDYLLTVVFIHAAGSILLGTQPYSRFGDHGTLGASSLPPPHATKS